MPAGYEQIEFKDIEKLQKDEAEKKKKVDKKRARILSQYGFEGDLIGETIIG